MMKTPGSSPRRPPSEVQAPPPQGSSSGSGSLHDRLGGATIARLVEAFYARVDGDPLLRPMYPKGLGCPIRGLTDFLTFWLGGPTAYDPHATPLRRRHARFAIDVRARDAWLAHMRAAVADVGIAAPEARRLMAHLEFGASALVNTGREPETTPCPGDGGRFDPRVAELWNRLAEIETLFEAVARGDLARVQSMLPGRLVPHAELLCHSGGLPPPSMIALLLSPWAIDLDLDPGEGDAQARFRHLQAMIEAHARIAPRLGADAPLRARLRSATRDRFVRAIACDPGIVNVAGPRGATLLHEAAMFGEAEPASALLGRGADPDARETAGHTPLYRAATGEVARLLIDAGATPDVPSGPTAGTPLHQAARIGRVSVAAVLLDRGANLEARDKKGETPLRRAVNCRQVEMVRLLIARGADPAARDRRGSTPLSAARSDEIRGVLRSARNGKNPP
jgi:truncated hemoglobin YjbI